MMGKGAVGN